jgi:hypothetical protein
MTLYSESPDFAYHMAAFSLRLRPAHSDLELEALRSRLRLPSHSQRPDYPAGLRMLNIPRGRFWQPR